MANISGRNREVNEVVQYLRAAEVGRLLLGELNGPMDWIDIQDFIMKPRRELKAIRSNVQRQLRDEIGRFCSRNFENVKAADLARLYEPLHQRGSSWRLPLVEFVSMLGRPTKSVLQGAPLHSTVVLSPWGLQTEYPEMHLIKDQDLTSITVNIGQSGSPEMS